MKQIMEDLILDWVKRENLVSTWHLNALLYEVADLMEWKEEGPGTLKKWQRRLRDQLNKMVKEGTLKKIRAGTGHNGFHDFGVKHSNIYFLPEGALDCRQK